MKIFNYKIDQRGDTLIEVTLALAIMTSVLTSAFLLSQKATTVGRIAKERSIMVAAAQQQAELLTAYRDRNPWNTFRSNTMGGDFYFNPDAVPIVPINGFANIAGVPTGRVYIRHDGGCIANSLCTHRIHYQASPPGGGALMQSKLILKLGNIDNLEQTVTGP